MKRREFDALVKKALGNIPHEFRNAVENIQIIVDDWPDPELLAEVTGDHNEVLYGLFTGRPLAERLSSDWGDLPAMIHIFRKPLEEDFADPEDLAREVEVTLVHEIAHYLGFDEETLERYGYD